MVLIEYPRKGIWGIAFVTGPAKGPLSRAFPEQQVLNCFIPTTPNPTSGFYLLVPEADIRDVDLSVEQAFKMIMSAGLVAPDQDGGDGAIPPPPDLLPPEARR